MHNTRVVISILSCVIVAPAFFVVVTKLLHSGGDAYPESSRDSSGVFTLRKNLLVSGSALVSDCSPTEVAELGSI